MSHIDSHATSEPEPSSVPNPRLNEMDQPARDRLLAASDWSLTSNSSFLSNVKDNEIETTPRNKNVLSDLESAEVTDAYSPCCKTVILKESTISPEEYFKHRTTLIGHSKVGSGNESLDAPIGGAGFSSRNEPSSLKDSHCENETELENLCLSNANESDGLSESTTILDDSPSPLLSNKTSTTTKKVPIWEKGLLSRKMLDKILTYFRLSMVLPVGISVISVVLSVAIFRNQSFVYHGKPMVISFNICEGIKSISYVVFRMIKVYMRNTEITWSSGYARYFVYYVMWAPQTFRRIGILHNALIALDRFFTIAFPLQRFNKRLVTRPKTCVAIIVASMCAYASAPLIIFFTEVEPLLDYQRKFRQDEIISEVYVANPSAFRKYWLVLTTGLVFLVYIPLALALVVNTLTIVSLWRHQKVTKATLREGQSDPKSGRPSKSQAVKRQTNAMVVVSSLVFTILVLFRSALPLISLFVKDFGEGRREMHLYVLSNDICIFLDCISPLVNFISYTTLSSQFRNRLRKIVLPAACLDMADNSQTSTSSTGNNSRLRN